FKNVDSGASWNSLSHQSGQMLAIDPRDSGTMYMASGDPGIFKSVDGGASWNPMNSGLPAASYNGTLNYRVTTVVIDPQNTSTLYAGTVSFGVFKSTNGGTSWSALNSGLTTLSIAALAFDPHDTSVLYASTAAGVFSITLVNAP